MVCPEIISINVHRVIGSSPNICVGDREHACNQMLSKLTDIKEDFINDGVCGYL